MTEEDIRQALRAWVAERHDMTHTVVREEFGLRNGEARADLVAINGALAGFEIKGPADSLRRLPRQVSVYDQVLESSWLVTTERYLPSAVGVVSAWWGLVRAEPDVDGLKLVVVREAVANPAVDAVSVTRLLWRAEVLDELRDLGLARGHARTPLYRLRPLLAGAVPLAELLTRVCRRLCDRYEAASRVVM